MAEAAMIVGTSNRPNDYNPADSYENATRKKGDVLKNMLSEGYITQEEYDLAMKENPEVVAQPDDTDNDNYMVSYAVHCATLRLMERQGFQFKYGFSSGKEIQESTIKSILLFTQSAQKKSVLADTKFIHPSINLSRENCRNLLQKVSARSWKAQRCVSITPAKWSWQS